LRGAVVERRSLTVELFVRCARASTYNSTQLKVYCQ